MIAIKLLDRHFSSLMQRIIQYTRVSQTTYVMIIAGVIGVLGGFGAIGFRWLISFFQGIAIGNGRSVLELVSHLSWYVKLLIPALGAAIVGPLVYFFAREAKGHGVPEVMEAVALRNGVIRPRVVVVKAFASAINIGTGGSVGREGPIVQIGSAFGSTIGQWLGLPPERLKILVACGAAAGIAATFNAPIAGAFFALEVILGNFALPALSPIILSSVLATVVSRAFLGNYPAFIVPPYALVNVWEIPLYMILGLLTGGVALAFTSSLYKAEDFFDNLKIPGYLKNPIGGFLIGCILIFAPNVYGVGYETINLALNGKLLWHTLIFLLLIKLLATNITLGSGGSGGIFAPSLFLGAVTGGAFGMGLHALFPDVTASSGAYALVGMGAVVAGTTHAPITAILILFELTGDYKIILPLMIACTISTIMARRLKEDSIYTLKLRRRGVSLSQGREEIIMKSFYVKDVMRSNAPVIPECAPFDEIVKTFLANQEPFYYVVNRNNELLGGVSIHVIKNVFHEEGLKNLVIARDLADSQIKGVSPKHTLADCMDRFARVDYEHLPVIEGNGSLKLLGYITRRDIIDLYNREILRKDVLGLKFVQDLGETKRKRDFIELPQEYKVDYLAVPQSFVGKTLKELAVRAKYNVSVIAIKKKMGEITSYSEVPSPDRILEAGDVLVVVGKESDVENLIKKAIKAKPTETQ